MMILTSVLIMMSSFFIFWVKNPFKASIILIVLSMSMFFSFHASQDWSFFSILLMMLFIGGIVLTFMVLSSLYPNEKILKPKLIFLFSILSFFIILKGSMNDSETLIGLSLFLDGFNFFFAMGIIFWYFFSFLKVVSVEKTSLRSCF